MEEIDIKRKAHEFRIDILNMIHKANSGHTGGSLSAIDILTTLYFGESKGKKFLNTDPKNPDWTTIINNFQFTIFNFH